MYFFNLGSKSFYYLELERVTSVVNCFKWVPIPVIKQEDSPPWIAKNWVTHPLPRAQWCRTHPLSVPAHLPIRLVSKSSKERNSLVRGTNVLNFVFRNTRTKIRVTDSAPSFWIFWIRPCEDTIDHRSCMPNLSSCEIKAWKRFRHQRESNP